MPNNIKERTITDAMIAEVFDEWKANLSEKERLTADYFVSYLDQVQKNIGEISAKSLLVTALLERDSPRNKKLVKGKFARQR